ncbi:DUF4221 family protein [Litoribacter populi]|uniref:DUF4221 family protein n=1 Tax=Litoribacter populi TaxID=2598460 RepID=UPI00117C3E8C|nr:DUF4221 family protein [Litoribacter populi]
MKRFLLPSLLALAFGCSQHIDENNAAQNLSLTFELDTVMVDAGEDIIYLQSALNYSDLSRDAKLLYNFNGRENLLEVMDMEKLELSHKIPFEQEGPNGTGRVLGLQKLDDGNFLLKEFAAVGIFSENAQRHQHYKSTELTDKGLTKDKIYYKDGVLDQNSQVFYTFYGEEILRKGIARVDFGANSHTKIPISQFETHERFTFKTSGNKGLVASVIANYLSLQDEKVLISNSVENNLIVYHPERDSMVQFSYKSELTPNEAKHVVQRELDSAEELLTVFKEYDKEIKFGKWLFDPESKRFFRLTTQFVMERDDKMEFQVVLTVFDREFQQVYEGITPLKKSSSKMFFRNGQLYLYENINDELGFIVLSINEV